MRCRLKTPLNSLKFTNYELNLSIFTIYLKGAVLMITLRVNSCKRKLSTVINLQNECKIRYDMSTRSAILQLASWFILTTENLGRGCGS